MRAYCEWVGGWIVVERKKGGIGFAVGGCVPSCNQQEWERALVIWNYKKMGLCLYIRIRIKNMGGW